LTYAWDFANDGHDVSNLQNPSFTYRAAGTYTVKLTVANAVGTDMETKSGYITVSPTPVAPAAAFTSNKQSGTAPLTIMFTDQSTGTAPLTYAWDFTNDGTRDSTSQNPSFTYQTPGTYTVKLTVTNALGTDVETKSGYITVTPPIPPTAAFTSNKQAGTAPLTVRFTDQSTGTAPLTFAWDCNNDGTRDSTSQNPSFTYSAAGTYTVKLTVSNVAGSDEETKIGFITVSPAPVAPTAAFNADIQSGTLPLTVTFTDQSTGTAPLTYAWDFKNDGSTDSTAQNPSFTYTTAGTYTVKLTVTNVAGSDGETKSGYITVTEVPIAPSAAFTSDKQTGYTPLTVGFTDQSAGTAPLSYEWDFNNDGIPDSTVRNPSFIYTTAGTFTVNLTVTNSLGSDAEIRTDYITVNPTIAPQAAFTADVLSGDAPLTVRFTDQSAGTAPLTYAWDFRNDGTTDSTAQNPLFTYTAAGTYTVKLTVTNAAGSDIRTETDYISITEPPVSSTSGIALTFDDNYIDEWYAARSIFQQYNAHVTFYVSQYNGLDENQIDKLRALQADGHEIAFHGMYHTDAAAYLETHTIQQYLDYEIIPGINLMQADGFDPVDFSYPFGVGYDNDELADALQQYFIHLRDTSHGSVYYQYGSGITMIHALGIDDTTYGQSLDDIYGYISTAKANDEIVIFYGHEPVPGNPGSYQTSYDRLDKILKYVSDNELKTFTISEIH
jgi:PKD repeat protein